MTVLLGVDGLRFGVAFVHSLGSRSAGAFENGGPSLADSACRSGRDRPGYPLRRDARG